MASFTCKCIANHSSSNHKLLLKRFAISNPSACRIGEMIHDVDLEDGKFQRVECVGLDLLFKGWARLGLSDAEILKKGFECFDALHATLGKKS